MVEPTSGKVTLLAVLVALIGPLAAEYSLIVVGALVGGYVGLSLRDPLPGLLRPLVHMLTGAGLALVLTPAGAAVAIAVVPAGWKLSIDVVLPVVALGVAMLWHPALTKWLPGFVNRWVAGGK
jgi:hypothetical protein